MEEKFYDVERLIDIKIMNKQIFVLTKWRDFSDEDNTWEPLTNLHPDSAISILKDLRIKN